MGHHIARNFRISTRKNHGCGLSIALSGDFAPTSACKRINRLDHASGSADRIAIVMNGLKSVNAIGLNRFIPEMNQLKRMQTDGSATGWFSEESGEQ